MGVGSFTGDLLVAQQTYTLSLLHTQTYVTFQTLLLISAHESRIHPILEEKNGHNCRSLVGYSPRRFVPGFALIPGGVSSRKYFYAGHFGARILRDASCSPA
jgi:hypothetical protein